MLKIACRIFFWNQKQRPLQERTYQLVKWKWTNLSKIIISRGTRKCKSSRLQIIFKNMRQIWSKFTSKIFIYPESTCGCSIENSLIDAFPSNLNFPCFAYQDNQTALFRTNSQLLNIQKGPFRPIYTLQSMFIYVV